MDRMRAMNDEADRVFAEADRRIEVFRRQVAELIIRMAQDGSISVELAAALLTGHDPGDEDRSGR